MYYFMPNKFYHNHRKLLSDFSYDLLYVSVVNSVYSDQNTYYWTDGPTARSINTQVKVYILTQTSNAKCFRNVTYIRGLAEIIVPIRGYGRHSPKQVMIKGE